MPYTVRYTINIASLLRGKVVVEAAAAFQNIVLQYVDSIQACDGAKGVRFIFAPAFGVTGGDFRQLAGQDFDEEVAVTAGRLA